MRHFFVFLILLYASVHDIKSMEVPDICFVLILFSAKNLNLHNALGFGIVILFYFVIAFICGILGYGVPFGMADAKIFAALAFSFGAFCALWIFCVSSMLAGIFAAYLVLLKKESKTTCFPYVPFITAAWSAYLLQLLVQGK